MQSWWAQEVDCEPEKGISWESCAVSDTETDISEDLDSSSSRAWSLDMGQIREGMEIPKFDPESTDEAWPQAGDKTMSNSAASAAPPEILLQIFAMLSPRDFDNARRTCSQWMRVGLNRSLLECMLKRAGWWDAWQQDCQTKRPSETAEQSQVWRMSRRFATECVLSGRKTNIEKRGFLATSVVDFSKLSHNQTPKPRKSSSYESASTAFKKAETTTMSKFNVSGCGNYVLVTSGCTIFIYRLLNRKARSSKVSLRDVTDMDIAPVTSIPCSAEVLMATMDTSTTKPVVAALLRGRIGMICDLPDSSVANASSPGDNPDSTPGENPGTLSSGMHPSEPFSRRYYYDVCSAEDPPRNVSICPGRRCLAFGCGSGIELHWVCETTNEDCRKRFPMTQPSEILHFLPNRPETPMELRLISSLAGPGMPGCQCHKESKGRRTCQIHLFSDVQQSFTQYAPGRDRRPSMVRATHCHHYRAVPINDGMHIMFIEPRTGLLCIGSDAPIGGPTSLTRALLCVPPFMRDSTDNTKAGLAPTVFAAGSDLSWGLRVVAAYGDRIVLYSVPLDVFNVVRKEHERQGDGVMGDSDLARDFFLDGERASKRRESFVPNQNGDWEFLLSVSYRPTAMMWPFKIYGKDIGTMDNVVELALQSSLGGVRVWAFGACGATKVFDVDTFSSPDRRPADIPCKSLSVDSTGGVVSTGLVNRAAQAQESTRKRKHLEPRIDFGGQYPITHQLHSTRLDGHDPSPGASQAAIQAAEKRRASFAACIVDFKVPELGAREGKWLDKEV